MERLLNYFKPAHYNLELCISTVKERIEGAVTVSGELLSDTVKFHAVDMEIKEVTFCNANQQNPETTPHPCQYKYDGETIEITLDDETKKSLAQKTAAKRSSAKHQPITFIIKYETKLNHNLQGCYVSTYEFNGAPQKLIATQFESHYAREAFPCIDEPAAKAGFALTIIVPDRQPTDVILANTELIKQDVDRFEFAPTPRMATYLLAWVIGPLRSVSGVNQGGIKVTSYAPLNQSSSSLEFANEVAMRALDYYTEKFQTPYPLAKLDQVALPDFEAGAMENWGLVTYRESCLLAEPNASVDTKQSVAITVTHELSHQWFGDLVTMTWWNDLWLNESFATIMEYYATDALYPELKAWQDFFTSDCVAALRRDAVRGVQAVQQEVDHPAEIATLFDSAIVYAKGARLVLMLMRLIGEDGFYKGVHNYFQKYQYQNTVGDDLWGCLQPYADFDVQDFMHAWISQPGYPGLQFCQNGNTTWWAQQRFFSDGTTDDSEWPLPEVKDDMSGHYLLELSDQELQDKLDQFAKLSEEQRLRLLIDRMILAKGGVVDPDSLIDLLPKFVNEDVAVWNILLSIINDLKVFFPYESEANQDYRIFLRNLIHAQVRRYQLDQATSLADASENRLRTILFVVARYARDMEIVQQLSQLYQNDLSALDAELRGNILMAKMLVDEKQVFSSLLQKYQTEHDPELKDDILGALASAKDSADIKLMLGLLERPEIVRPQDHLFLFVYLLRNEKVRPQAIDWLYAHWDLVKQLAGEKSVEDYLRCLSGYIQTQAEFDRFQEFFAPLADDPILKRTFAMAQADIEARLGLIQHYGKNVQAKVHALVAA